jgi:hyperosmotically inducible protein
MHKIPVRKISIHRVTLGAGLVALLGLATTASADNAAAPQPHSDGLGAAITDTVTTTKVKGKLMGEESLDKSDIGVSTTNGAVTLDGSASGSDEKALAESTTKSTEGVTSVDNNLTTPSDSAASAKTKSVVEDTKEIASDSWITAKVKSELLVDSLSKGFKVGVTTLDGVVVLTGNLANSDAIGHVKGIAGSVEGVKSVDSSALTITVN